MGAITLCAKHQEVKYCGEGEESISCVATTEFLFSYYSKSVCIL